MENTGQHWSEKIAYHIAQTMDILAPRVELAEFEGVKGSATQSFTSVDNYELYHGNQILKGFDPSYDDDDAIWPKPIILYSAYLMLWEVFLPMEDEEFVALFDLKESE